MRKALSYFTILTVFKKKGASKNSISKMTGIPRTTVGRIIKHNLSLKSVKKSSTTKLSITRMEKFTKLILN